MSSAIVGRLPLDSLGDTRCRDDRSGLLAVGSEDRLELAWIILALP